MANNSDTDKRLSIDEISGELIKKELREVVRKLTGSENVELGIEPGSKKGKVFINGTIFHRIKTELLTFYN